MQLQEQELKKPNQNKTKKTTAGAEAATLDHEMETHVKDTKSLTIMEQPYYPWTISPDFLR